MKISIIFTIVLFIVALLGSIAGTSYYYTQCNKAMTTEVYAHLESVAQSRANHVGSFLEEQKIKIGIAQRDNDLVDFLKLVKQGKDYSPLEEEVNNDLNEFLYKDFAEIDLWGTNGIVLISTNKDLIGTDYSATDFYKMGKTEPYIGIYADPISGESKIGITSPFFDESTGEFLGIYAALISTDNLDRITLDKTGMGKTGEVYLINKEGYAITPLLFVEDAVLEWKVDTFNSRNCFSHFEEEEEEHEEVQIFLDYTGKRVIGTHYPITELGWCLLAEIDEEEVLGSQRALFQRVSLTIIIALVIIITLIGFFIGKFMDKRVVLKKGKKEL